MLFSTYLLSFVNEKSEKGDLAREFFAGKSNAKTYLGVFKYFTAKNATYSTLMLLKKIKKEYDKNV